MRGRALVPLGLSLLVCAICASCSQELFDSESNLVVLNDSGCTVTVLVDGRKAFSMKPGQDHVLDDIGAGRHVLEALDAAERVIERQTVDLARGEDFYWTLDHC